MALQLIRKTEIPLWDISHSTAELKDAEAENFTSYLLNYEGKEEAQDPSKAAYKYFSDKMHPEGNVTDVDYFSEYNEVKGYSPPALMCDFNRSPHCWAVGQQQDDLYLIFAEIYTKDAVTREQAEDAAKVFKTHGITFVELYGDATGKAKGRAKTSDWGRVHEVLKENDIAFKKCVPRSNPYREERVKESSNVIYSGDDDRGLARRRLIINERCTEVIDDYKYATTGDNGEKKKDQGDRGHMSDACDYWIYAKEKGGRGWTYIT